MNQTSTTTSTYPESREIAGPKYWGTLFNTAARYPETPSIEQRRDISNYIKSTIKNFVCDDCVENTFTWMRDNPIRNHNRKELMEYLCELKNNSNEHEGKEKVDCGTFYDSAIDKNAKTTEECQSCLIEKVHAPSVDINKPRIESPTPPTTSYYIPPTSIYNPGTGFTYANMDNILARYPNVKRAMNLNPASAYKTQQSQAFVTQQSQVQPAAVNGMVPVATAPGVPGQINELSQRYPTLAGIDLSLDGGNQQEELDGVLKSLDSIYKGPAEIVGIPASQMNLAYTPEILTNGVSLVTQMYLTNAGSMLTSLLASIGMIGVSIFAKNSIANYDRLFLQNIAGSFLFHTLNFLNPRAKDDLMPDLKKLFEGATKADISKVKEALLYKNKEEGNVADKSAQKLLDMIKNKKGIIDMKKLAANHKDLRSMANYGSTGGTLSKEEFEDMLNDDSPALLGDGVNLENLSDVDNEFGAILGSGGF